MPDVQTAASSTAQPVETASDQAIADRDFAAYEKLENARTAKPTASDQPAEKDRAEPATAKEPPADPTAAPAAATEKSIQEPDKSKGEERKTKLGAEIGELLKQRAALKAELEAAKPVDKPVDKPGDKKADPPPAAAVQTKAAPKKPSLNDFKTFAEYDAANDAYISELVEFKANEVVLRDRAEQATAAVEKAHAEVWDAQVTAAKAEYADFAEVAFSKDTPITPVMDGFLQESPHAARVLYRLGENDSAEGKRIAGLQPFAAVRALVAIETALTPAAKKDPPVKKVTAAPPPATDLAAKNSEPADEADAALAAKDFTRYERVMNARRKAA